MLSQLCLPKSTSSVPSTSGGLRAPVTNALKHRENKYNRISRRERLRSPSAVFPLRPARKKNKWKGHHAGTSASVSGDKWIHVLG